MLKISRFLIFSILLVVAFTSPALAQGFSVDLGTGGSGSVTGRIIQLIALISVMALAPSLLIMMTSFTRIIVVLSFLRTAIGIQQTPPNTVMISLALFLTFFIMAPTFQHVYDTAVVPLVNEDIEEIQAFERGADAFKIFMVEQVRDKDLELFLNIADEKEPETATDVSLQVIIPAFMISELRRAFEIGFMLFLPFLIIDLVTASILMSMGMMMLPPVTISLPFKIIFFVLVDGWYLIAGSLVQSFDQVPLGLG